MNYLYLLFALIIVFLIIDTINKGATINDGTKVGHVLEKKINPTNIGFVKPEHKLLQILNNISNGDKIKLSGICNNFIYNKNTINTDLNEL